MLNSGQAWAPHVRCPRIEVARTPQPRARCRCRLGSRAALHLGSAAQRAPGGGSGCPPMGRGRLACTAAAPPAAESAVWACGGLQRRARRRRSVARLFPAGGGAGQRRAAAGRAEAPAVSACRLGRYAVAAAVAGAARGTEGFDTGTLAPRRSTVRPIYFTHAALSARVVCIITLQRNAVCPRRAPGDRMALSKVSGDEHRILSVQLCKVLDAACAQLVRSSVVRGALAGPRGDQSLARLAARCRCHGAWRSPSWVTHIYVR